MELVKFYDKVRPLREALLLSLCCCLLGACTDKTSMVDDKCTIEVSAEAVINQTKTSLSGTKLSWSSGDRIGVYVNSAQYNMPFQYSSGVSTFFGFFHKCGEEAMTRDVYAYYPYISGGESACYSTIIQSNMPITQTMPFHSSLDIMVSDVSTMEYDESDMPGFNVTFNRHLFSILKINFTNSSDAFVDQYVYGIRLESKTKTLCGTFSFDVSKGGSAVATFDSSKEDNLKYIDCRWSKNPSLEKGKVQSIYVLIPPGDYPSGDISVSICTQAYDAVVTTNKEISLEQGTIYNLETIDFASYAVATSKKTVICFGDSITTNVVTGKLQELLGWRWLVLNAGVSSERCLQIMSRQGIAPLYVKGGFTIPAHQEEYMNMSSGLLTTYHTDGVINSTPDISVSPELSYYTGNGRTYCGHTNPFKVKGVECELVYRGSVVALYRLADGDAVDCTADEYVQVIPCADWKYGTPDVTTIYMGTNGAYASYQVLADWHNKIKSKVSGKGFIGIGYHHYKYNDTYRDVMQNTIGDNYLNLRVDGCNKAATIMKSMGLELTEEDYENLEDGIWPVSWGDPSDVHPNTTGAKAHAYLIYYKMQELGYVD